jgi:hypothetical protein
MNFKEFGRKHCGLPLVQHLFAWTEENQEESQNAPRLKLEPSIFQIQVAIVTSR